MNIKGYEVFVEPISIEPGIGYAAVVPALPHCMSEGETPEEAIARVGDAIDLWHRAAAKLRHAASGVSYGLMA